MSHLLGASGSRGRERWSWTSRLPLRARELVPRATHDHDPLGPAFWALELDDVPGIEGLEVRAGAFVATDQRVVRARHHGAGVRGALDLDVPTLQIDFNDDDPLLLQGVRHTLSHSGTSLSRWPRGTCRMLTRAALDACRSEKRIDQDGTTGKDYETTMAVSSRAARIAAVVAEARTFLNYGMFTLPGCGQIGPCSRSSDFA